MILPTYLASSIAYILLSSHRVQSSIVIGTQQLVASRLKRSSARKRIERPLQSIELSKKPKNPEETLERSPMHHGGCDRPGIFTVAIQTPADDVIIGSDRIGLACR